MPGDIQEPLEAVALEDEMDFVKQERVCYIGEESGGQADVEYVDCRDILAYPGDDLCWNLIYSHDGPCLS